MKEFLQNHPVASVFITGLVVDGAVNIVKIVADAITGKKDDEVSDANEETTETETT